MAADQRPRAAPPQRAPILRAPTASKRAEERFESDRERKADSLARGAVESAVRAGGRWWWPAARFKGPPADAARWRTATRFESSGLGEPSDGG